MLNRFRGKIAAFLAAVALAAMVPAAHATSSMPTGLQPSDMVTAIGTESVAWLSVGIGLIIGITLLVAFVRGFTRKASRAVK